MPSPVMGPREWVLLVTLSVLWGGSFFFAEVALADMPPLTVVVGRVAIAALALTIGIYVTGGRLPGGRGLWGAFLVMGALNNAVPFSLIVWGQVHIDSGLAAILNATTPLFTVLLAHVLTADERLTPARLAGVLIGLAGVAVLIGPDALQGLGAQALAQLAVVAAAVSYACAGIYGRRFKTVTSAQASAGMLIGATVWMLPLALLVDRPWTLAPGPLSLAAVAAMALLCTALAYLLYFQILAAAGATNLLLVTFLIPVSALLLGVFILGEDPAWTAYAGMALIFAGLAAIDGRLWRKLRRRKMRAAV